MIVPCRDNAPGVFTSDTLPLFLVSLSSLEDESDELSDESAVFFTNEALEVMNCSLREDAPDLTGGATSSLLSLSSLDDSKGSFASAAALASIFLEDTGAATGFSLIGSAFFEAVFLVLLSFFAIADSSGRSPTSKVCATVMTPDTKFWVDHYT
jgi:hypothetical protein